MTQSNGVRCEQGTPETYIIKWQDIINKDENVVLTSTPVKSTTTSVDALGACILSPAPSELLVLVLLGGVLTVCPFVLAYLPARGSLLLLFPDRRREGGG